MTTNEPTPNQKFARETLENINQRIANTDLRETYFIARRFSTNSGLRREVDASTLNMLDRVSEGLRELLVNALGEHEQQLDNDFYLYDKKHSR